MAKIKICGLFRDRDIGFVNEAMPDYAGFVLCFPKSHRCVTLEDGIRLRSKLSPSVRAVGVFVDQDIEKVASYADAMKLDVIQLHGHEDNAYIEKLRANAACQVWKAFVIRTAEDLTEARKSAADMILLDGGLGEGGTFDWKLPVGFERPFILAGGLTPERIREAGERLRPAGYDISSGVESGRVKDGEKIAAAVAAARGI